MANVLVRVNSLPKQQLGKLDQHTRPTATSSDKAISGLHQDMTGNHRIKNFLAIVVVDRVIPSENFT